MYKEYIQIQLKLLLTVALVLIILGGITGYLPISFQTNLSDSLISASIGVFFLTTSIITGNKLSKDFSGKIKITLLFEVSFLIVSLPVIILLAPEGLFIAPWAHLMVAVLLGGILYALIQLVSWKIFVTEEIKKLNSE